MNSPLKRLAMTLAVGTSTLLNPKVSATSSTWTNALGGNWSTPLNWSPNKVPGAGDSATITKAGTYNVIVDVNTSISSLSIGASTNLQTLQVPGGVTLTIQSSGTVNAKGALTVAAGGAVNLPGTASLNLSGGMTSAGSINVSNGNIALYNNGTASYVGGLINQGGQINFAGNGGINGNAGSFLTRADYFYNYGTVNKDAGTITTISVSTGVLEGAYNAAAGTMIEFVGLSAPLQPDSSLMLSGPGQLVFDHGTLLLPTQTITNLVMSTCTLELGPLFQGGSITNLLLTNNVVLAGNYTISGILTMTNNCALVGTNILTGTLAITNGSLEGSLSVASGGVAFLNDVRLGDGYYLATLSSSSGCALTVEGGGILDAVGFLDVGNNNPVCESSVTIAPSGVANIGGTTAMQVDLLGGITNAGTMNLTNATIYLQEDDPYLIGGVVNLAGGQINFRSGATIYGNDINLSSPNDYFYNYGTVNNCDGEDTLISASLGVLEGTYNAAAGTSIEFEGQMAVPLQPDSSLVLNGPGQFLFGSGYLYLPTRMVPNLDLAAGRLVLGPTFEGGTITNLWLDGITLTGTNTITGTMEMTSGTLAGAFTVANGGVLSIESSQFSPYVTASLAVQNGGVLNLLDGSALYSSDIYFQNSLTVASGGVVNIAGSVNALYPGLDAGITNAGTINLTNAVIGLYNNGTTNYQGGLVNLPGGQINLANGGIAGCQYGTSSRDYFFNYGTVNKLAGPLEAFVEATIGVLEGTYNAPAGTIIEFIGQPGVPLQVDPSLLLIGPGQFQFAGGLLLLPTGTIPDLMLTGGTVELGPGFEGGCITNLPLNGTTNWMVSHGITLVGTNTFAGNVAMTNCILSGTFTVTNGGVLTLNNAALNGLNLTSGLTVQSGGVLNLNGGNFTVGGNSSASVQSPLTVAGGGQLDADPSACLLLYGPMTNSGICSLAGQGLEIFNNGVTNEDGGLVNLSSGVINLIGSAGIIVGAGSSDYLLNQGVLQICATNNTSLINVDNFTNSGTLSVEHGTLQLGGANLSLQPSGTFSVGLNSATDFGTINYIGGAALNLSRIGTFNVVLNGGYVPALNSPFQVLFATGLGSFSGGFTNFLSPSGTIWLTNYTTVSLTIKDLGQVNWGTPANITYGTTLCAGQLNAALTPNLTGSFAYNPPAGTLLNAGAGQLLTATFTPSAAGETAASLQVPLTVLKAPLTIIANSTNKIVGETLAFSGTEFTASGLQNSETIGTVTIMSPGVAASAPAGVYNLIPSSPAGGTFFQGNYTNTMVNGTLIVTATPPLAMSARGNQNVFNFPTLSGHNYQMQYSTNLSRTNWTALGGPVSGINGMVNLTNTLKTPQIFYRLQITH